MSNRDHGVNAGHMLDDGTLLACVGGMTNQGYPGENMGWLPESPYSAAVIGAKVTYHINDLNNCSKYGIQ